MIRTTVLMAAVLIATALTGAQASADTLTWKIRSTYPYRIYLEFYSQDYNRAWPGGGEVYVLKDSRYHTYRLNCSTGEKICYGAWVTTDQGTYWGVGQNDEEGCSDCCTTCGGNAGRRTLSE